MCVHIWVGTKKGREHAYLNTNHQLRCQPELQRCKQENEWNQKNIVIWIMWRKTSIFYFLAIINEEIMFSIICNGTAVWIIHWIFAEIFFAKVLATCQCNVCFGNIHKHKHMHWWIWIVWLVKVRGKEVLQSFTDNDIHLLEEEGKWRCITTWQWGILNELETEVSYRGGFVNKPWGGGHINHQVTACTAHWRAGNTQKQAC